MGLADWVNAQHLMRWLPVAFLAWLAIFFGMTLRRGHTPLIERIARVSDPHLPPELCLYTRRLTFIWCAYFVVLCALVPLLAWSAIWLVALPWVGTLMLFVGEHWLRRRLFPGRIFPGLRQQAVDTVRVWRTRA